MAASRSARAAFGPPAAAMLLPLLLASLPCLGSSSRNAARVDFAMEDGPAPEGAFKKDEEDECKAAVVKCAGVRIEKANKTKAARHDAEKAAADKTPAPAPVQAPVHAQSLVGRFEYESLFRGEAGAAAHGQDSSNQSGSEQLLSVDTSRTRFEDYNCDKDEWTEFKKKFGLSGGGGFPEANFDSGGICKENNVVWLYPKHDPNKAYHINRNVCHRLLSWSKHACSVQVRRVGSIGEALEYLSRFGPDSIVHLVLGGHGTGYSIQWGMGADGFFGIEQPGQVPVGSVVKVTKDFERLNMDLKMVQEGDRGYVGTVDRDGDGIVWFEMAGESIVSMDEFGHTIQKVTSPMPSYLMDSISRKMQAHGSVFTDSCYSATEKYNPNIAGWMAKHVGKGVRVTGSETSMSKVEVKRFQGAWHASIVGSGSPRAERVFVNSEARCPSFALYSKPDSSGNCACPMFEKCKTRGGKKCPAANNRESSKYFLPFCGESWAKDPCECGGATSASIAPPLLIVLLCVFVALLQQQ